MTDSILGMTGKNILVIGGGQGMGSASARLAAQHGANVSIVDVEASRAQEVAKELATLGIKTMALAANVLEADELRSAIATTHAEFGSIDGMVCVVGQASWRPLVEMPLEMWDLDHNLNLRYVFLAAQEVARRAIEADKPCSIVSVSSVDGISSAPYHGAYGAAKAGLINLTKSMAAEWTEHRVRVNTIAPGTIVSPRIPRKSAEEEIRRYGRIPAGGRGTVEDIAKAALFLLSEMSTYVSGIALPVDGGFLTLSAVDYRPRSAKAPHGK